ncbi:MAG: DUF4230 domain-containing protein [Armatimonadota bacterium]
MKQKIFASLFKPAVRTAGIVLAGIIIFAILASSIGPGIVQTARKAIGNLTARIITVTSPAPIIVEKLQALNRLETASQSSQQVVEAKSEAPVLPQFLFKDSLLMMVHTETIAGIDLSNLSEKDIKFDGKTVTVKLPSPQIFYVRIDEHSSKVFNRQRGWLVLNPDIDLERQARIKAQTDAREAAIKSEILITARTNAENNLKLLLRSLGFKQVEFKWGDSSSETAALA